MKLVNKSRKPILKQVEQLYKFDRKEAAFFKPVKGNVELKKTLFNSFRSVLERKLVLNRKGYDIHTHYYKDAILPSILDIFKPYGLKKKYSDVIVVVSDKQVQGAIVFKVDNKIMNNKIDVLKNNNSLFQKIYAKMFTRKERPGVIDYLTLKKYIRERAINEYDAIIEKRKLDKYFDGNKPKDEYREQLIGLSTKILFDIYNEFGVTIKFLANDGFVFKKSSMCFKEKRK